MVASVAGGSLSAVSQKGTNELRTDDTRRSIMFTRLLISDAFRCIHNFFTESSEENLP